MMSKIKTTDIDATGVTTGYVLTYNGTIPVFAPAAGGISDAPNDGNIYGRQSLAWTNVTSLFALKAPLASPALTGTPVAPTATAGTSTTQLATTAFVTTADNLKLNLAGGTLTGSLTVPTIVGTSGTLNVTGQIIASSSVDAQTPGAGTTGGFRLRAAAAGTFINQAFWQITDAAASVQYGLMSFNSSGLGAWSGTWQATQLTGVAGTANATEYTPLSLTGGAQVDTRTSKTTGCSTTAKVLLSAITFSNLIQVYGTDGTNQFSDLIMMSVGSGSVNVISSLAAAGAPAARTYGQSSSSLVITMASGTYTVAVSSTSLS